MKYRDENGKWQELYLPPTGDTLPIGTVVDYDGDEVPYGYEEVENKINFYSSKTNSITITPSYDCYAIVEYVTSTWGYAGGNCTVSISNGNGAEEIYNNSMSFTGGNQISRPTMAKGVFKCIANKTYSFSGRISNSGGATDGYITITTIPV